MSSTRIDQLKQMLAEEPDEPFLLYALAMEYNNANNHQVALQYYEELTLKHRHYQGTYYHLAKLYERLEQTDKAIATYEQGMQICQQLGDQHSYNELRAAYNSLRGIEPDDEDY